MIREALIEDIPRLVELGSRMHEESERFRELSFDATRLAFTLKAAIESDAAFCWVVERDEKVVGGMFAVLTPHWFSPDLTSCDLALFMAPEHRGTMAPARLLNAYATWARDRGAKQILFGIMTGVRVEETVALCEALGWRRAGVVMEI